MMAASTIMAVIMGSVVVAMRSGYAVWNAHEQDLDIAENGYDVLRHIVRQLRQAQGVTAITAASNMAGSLSYANAAGTIQTWSLDGSSQVNFNNGTSTQLLAKSINQMSFIGYKADGVTTTTTVDEIQMVKCTVQFTLTKGGGTTRNVSAIAWIRSW